MSTWKKLMAGGPSDPIPDAFTVTDLSGLELSTQYSQNVTPVGYDIPTTWSVSVGDARTTSNATYATSGTLLPGETLTCRATSSASFSTAVNVTVTIGGVTDTWSLTTRAQDVTPNAFTFTDVTGANISTQYTATVTPSGYDSSISWSITGGNGSGMGSVAGGGYTTSGTITLGQSLTVRANSPALGTTTENYTVSIGGTSDVWSITTADVIGEQSYTTSGAYTFTVPSGVTNISVALTPSVGDSSFNSTALSASNAPVRSQTYTPTGTYAGNYQYAYQATNGSNLWVIAGNNNSGCLRSTDGINFTSSNTFPSTSIQKNGVYWGGNKFVIWSQDASYPTYLWESTDGITWTQSSFTWSSGDSGIGYFYTFHMEYLNNTHIRLVIINGGENGYVSYSTNGTTWSSCYLIGSAFASSGDRDGTKIAYGNGVYVVVRGSPAQNMHSYTQQNLTQWSTAYNVDNNNIYTECDSLIFANGQFVLVTRSGWVYYQSNGQTWTKTTRVIGDSARGALAYDTTYSTYIIYTYNKISKSKDLTNWTDYSTTAESQLNHPHFCSVFKDGILYRNGLLGGADIKVFTYNVRPTITNATGTLYGSQFSLNPNVVASGSYGKEVAAWRNNISVTPGNNISVNVGSGTPSGAVRIIWGTGRSFPNNGA